MTRAGTRHRGLECQPCTPGTPWCMVLHENYGAGVVLTKLAASSVLPEPLYLATLG
jgi:hypothetical protein